MRKLVCFLFLLSPLFLFSQNVVIKGNASFFANQTVDLLKYTNPISGEQQILNQVEIDSNGQFNIPLTIDEPQEIRVKIEMRELTLHVHPHSIIHLQMDSLANADNQRVPFKVHITYDRIPTFIAKEKDYQDLQIDFANHQLEISKKDTLSIFYTTFFDSTEIKYAKTLQSDTLFYNYYHYFKAQTLLGSELSKTLIYNQYIGNKPILYSNEDYLRFFKSLCLPLVNKQLSKHTQAVEEAKSTYQVYEAFMKVLVREPLFKRKEVRSLALQLYCMRNELNSILSQQTKNGIINQMANFCLYPDQKLAAQYYQLNADRIEIGNEAPDFQLISTQGELKALTSYRKKIAYVGFINSKSTTCIRDLQVIDALKKKYKRVNFIFVICDRDSLQMGNLPQEANNLHYLFIDKNYSALETYEIWNFPVYYLLDKHGYFLQAPAKKPEQIIDDLRVLNMTKSERKRYEIIKE